jgi:hypothetical protein
MKNMKTSRHTESQILSHISHKLDIGLYHRVGGRIEQSVYTECANQSLRKIQEQLQDKVN